MEYELLPAFIAPSGAFSILIAPQDLLLAAIEQSLRRARTGVLYICGNYSRLLDGIDRRCPDFSIRRAFTVFQLLTILEEADGNLIIMEHDASLYDDAPETVRHLALACADRARTAGIVLLAAGFDPALRTLAGQANRVLYIEKPVHARRAASVCVPFLSAGQTTLEV
jgi:hypothetical protein